MEECAQWLDERMVAFEKAFYTLPMRKNSEEHSWEGAWQDTRDVDPEAVLLEGRSGALLRRKACGEFKITINENLGKIGHPLLRKHVVQHTIIHELLHIENEDLITLSKDYAQRKKRRIHRREFDEKIHERFNEIRTASGLPPVKNMADVEAAIPKIVDGIKL